MTVTGSCRQCSLRVLSNVYARIPVKPDISIKWHTHIFASEIAIEPTSDRVRPAKLISIPSVRSSGPDATYGTQEVLCAKVVYIGVLDQNKERMEITRVSQKCVDQNQCNVNFMTHEVSREFVCVDRVKY